MKDRFNLKDLFPTYDGKDLSHSHFVGDEMILCVFTSFLCLVGLVGNGKIIWLLGFRMKRKPLVVYVLNLAVADLGSLVLLLPFVVWYNTQYFYEYSHFPAVLFELWRSLFLSIGSSHDLLLAAISIDRGVSVLFPNRYRNHWSPVWPTTVCAFIWALPVAFRGVSIILSSVDLIPYDAYEIRRGHIVTTVICLLLMIFSTLTLFVQVCLKSPPCQCGKLSKVILLILLSSILFTILTCGSLILPQIPVSYYWLCVSLKGNLNPLIFFLAGRRNGSQFQERMKVILQRVFKEERDPRMERAPRTHTSNL